MRRQLLRAVNALRRRDEIGGRRLIDAWYKLLGIAVNHWKPCRLHLHHDPVSFQEHVVMVPEWNSPLLWLVRFERCGMFVTLEIATATHLHRDGQFIPIERVRIAVPFGWRNVVGAGLFIFRINRSEERRVGKECRSRWS